MDTRERQVARNEAFFRNVNEEIEQLAGRSAERLLDIVCECGLADCMKLITIGGDEYEAVREYGNRFIVVPGHEVLQYEEVVSEHDAYLIVEKRSGGAAELAQALDPRR
jgi:hypothetical protein